MSDVSFLNVFSGQWQGVYQLWLDPTKDPEESVGNAERRFVAGSDFLLWTYSWNRGGTEQQGVFLLGGRRDAVSATWGDTFHSSPAPMICEGQMSDRGSLLMLNGQYQAADETWGWRTTFAVEDAGGLKMEAFNIWPNGQEDLAVRCEFKPSSS